MAKEARKAVAYLRTSSAANVGSDKDSDKRQRAAINAYHADTGTSCTGSEEIKNDASEGYQVGAAIRDEARRRQLRD